MSEQAGGAEPSGTAISRADILRRLAEPVDDPSTVVNSVLVSELPPGVAPVDARQSRKRRRQRDPNARIDFGAWSTLPWRDRPLEARLADEGRALANAILANPAWHHELLDTHRVRLDPQREAADIAYAAYRLYGTRIELGPRPAGPDNAVLTQAQALFDDHFATLTMTWNSLVDRVTALANYRAHLTELAPIVSALDAVRHLSDARLDTDMTTLFADAARSDMAASDTRDLQGGIDGMGSALVAVIGRLGEDVRGLAALSGRADPSAGSR